MKNFQEGRDRKAVIRPSIFSYQEYNEIEKSVLKRSAVHWEMVTECSTFKAYESFIGTCQRIIGDLAASRPFETTGKLLTEQQAQNSLNSTSMDLHVTKSPPATNYMRYLANGTKYIKSYLPLNC